MFNVLESKILGIWESDIEPLVWDYSNMVNYIPTVKPLNIHTKWDKYEAVSYQVRLGFAAKQVCC